MMHLSSWVVLPHHWKAYARAKKGVFHLLTLQERVENRPLPPVTVVDMRAELHKGNRTMFSSQLYKKIKHCLDKEEQMVLFLNRRGFSTFYVQGLRLCSLAVRIAISPYLS